jgi:hypothetical protein
MAVEMKKQFRKFAVKFELEWEYGVDINKIRADLDAIEKLGATHINIEVSTRYDCEFLTIEGYTRREETDEEFSIRKEEQLERERRTEQRELAELKRLKDKYN